MFVHCFSVQLCLAFLIFSWSFRWCSCTFQLLLCLSCFNCVRNTVSTSKTYSMSSMTSKRHLTGCGMMHCGPQWGSTTWARSWFSPSRSYTWKPPVQYLSKIGSTQQSGVHQGCLLSPTLFNIFLECIMMDALKNHFGMVSIGGHTITNLQVANDINGLTGTEEELVNLVKSLDETASRYGREISIENTKLMTNCSAPIMTNITVSGERTWDHEAVQIPWSYH